MLLLLVICGIAVGIGVHVSFHLAVGLLLILASLAYLFLFVVEVVGLFSTTQTNQIMLALAVQLGSSQVEARMRTLLEPTSEPKSFNDGCFGFFYHMGEKWPRGQLSALRMAAEIGDKGSWERAFNNPGYRGRFSAPTVEGVDFPVLGLSQAWNDNRSGSLFVSTYAATPSRYGEDTTIRIVHLPDAKSVTVERDGSMYHDVVVINESSIEIRTDVGEHKFVIFTGFQGNVGHIGSVEVG